jgi:Super-infection exclusion protein B
MGDAIAKLLDWAKSPRQAAIVFLSCATLLLLPSRVLSRFNLSSFDRYRGWLALVAVLSFAVLSVELGIFLWNHFATKYRNRTLRLEREEHLQKLSAEEQGILLGYMSGSSDTQYLFTNDGNVGSLVAKKVLYLGAKTGFMTPHGPRHAVNIQPWAKDFLTNNPELLQDAKSPSLPPSPFAPSGH